MRFNIPKVALSLFNKKIQDEIKALPDAVEVPDIDDLPEEFSKKFTVEGLWETLKKSSRTLGEESLFNVLVLYYSLESEKMTLAHLNPCSRTTRLITALIEPKLRFIDAMAKPRKTNQSLNCAASAEVYWSKEPQPRQSVRYFIDHLV